MKISDYIYIIKTLIKPNESQECVEDIHLEKLYSNGYQTIILDIDNTILRHDERVVTLQKLNWIEKAKTIGYRIYLFSNNSSYKRTKRIAAQLDLRGRYFALKPLTDSLKELAEEEFINLDKCLIIGDKLLTDVILGNWINGYTIKVEPLDKKSSFFRMLQGEIESFLLYKIEDWI